MGLSIRSMYLRLQMMVVRTVVPFGAFGWEGGWAVCKDQGTSHYKPFSWEALGWSCERFGCGTLTGLKSKLMAPEGLASSLLRRHNSYICICKYIYIYIYVYIHIYTALTKSFHVTSTYRPYVLLNNSHIRHKRGC